MGTDAHVLVDGDAALLRYAHEQLASLERRWTRFDEGSELMRLNRDGAAAVSPETFAVVERAVHAWSFTDGLFDPTVHAAMVANGYDRDFGAVLSGRGARSTTPSPAPGCDGIVLDRDDLVVKLPSSVALDLGGIGKGFAADLVATELVASGADAALVNVGGDLRAAGQTSSGWVLTLPDGSSATIADGGVATSSTRRRRWDAGGTEMHHIVDPRTGRPGTSEVATATVFAAEAWWAEVLAKAALLAGPVGGDRLLERAGVGGILWGGCHEASVAMEAYRA